MTCEIFLSLPSDLLPKKNCKKKEYFSTKIWISNFSGKKKKTLIWLREIELRRPQPRFFRTNDSMLKKAKVFFTLRDSKSLMTLSGEIIAFLYKVFLFCGRKLRVERKFFQKILFSQNFFPNNKYVLDICVKI